MEHYYKLFIIGNSTVGKTALIQRYFNNTFSLASLSTNGKAININAQKELRLKKEL